MKDLFLSGVLGFAVTALLYLWKKGSVRWAHWFPLLKKGIELSLKAAVAVVAVYATYTIANSEDVPMNVAAALIGAAVPGLYLRFVKNIRFGDGDEKIKRGTQMATVEEVSRAVFKKSKRNRLNFGGVPVPLDAEPYHFLIAGATGTGKSVAINQILQELRAANDTVILVDSGGDFLARHFQKDTDFVFNPFDERCVNWSPLLEMHGEWDAEALARSIIPDAVGESKEWNSYAQTFVSAVLRKLWTTNQLKLEDLLYYVLSAPTSELKTFLQGTAATAQMSSEKTFGSIRTIASNYLTAYSYLPGKGDAFSVTEMVRAEHSGFLFLTYRDDQLDSLRSLLGCVLDVTTRAILSMPPDPNRRVWLIIDEFASVGKVQSIEAVATKARKAGGCLLIGLQSVSQLKDRYGEHGAQTILSCLSTWLVLRSPDADTAEYMSKYVGDVELVRQSRSLNVSETGDSQGRNEQQTTQRAVLPSQIQALPNLHGYLKLAGGYPLCEVKLETKGLKTVKNPAPSFQMRDLKTAPLLDFNKREGAAPTVDTSAPAQAMPTAEPSTRAAKEELVKGVTVGLAKPAAPEPLRHTHVLVTRRPQ
ncbi:type IV secretion system DNA-binding domain-containing protein [Nostoc sp. CHAB 5834]|nr:type IV secretion system DNA-binding domain-containing protein [Nostoc sp. CHAB 5834]